MAKRSGTIVTNVIASVRREAFDHREQMVDKKVEKSHCKCYNANGASKIVWNPRCCCHGFVFEAERQRERIGIIPTGEGCQWRRKYSLSRHLFCA